MKEQRTRRKRDLFDICLCSETGWLETESKRNSCVGRMTKLQMSSSVPALSGTTAHGQEKREDTICARDGSEDVNDSNTYHSDRLYARDENVTRFK